MTLNGTANVMLDLRELPVDIAHNKQINVKLFCSRLESGMHL